MKIIFDYWDGGEPDSADIADEVKRVGGMLEDGYTSGELTAGDGAGWWSIEE